MDTSVPLSYPVLESLKLLSDFSDVARFLGISNIDLKEILFSTTCFYRSFVIPKKKGGVRQIDAPKSKLKKAQRKLNEVLQVIYEEIYGRRKYITGFRKKVNCVDNARRHQGKKLILNIDLLDFFQQITFPRVYGLFVKEPFCLKSSIAAILANMCLTPEKANGIGGQGKKFLPQGAPTSPVLSNFILARLDSRLHKFAKEKRLFYSRYADDITFSTNEREAQLREMRGDIVLKIREIIEEKNGFQINNEKFHCFDNSKRQVVTGLTVNEKVNVSRRYLSQVRAILHDWGNNGEQEALKKYLSRSYKNRKVNSIQNVVLGKLNFLKQVCGSDTWVYRQLKYQYDVLTYAPFPIICSQGRKYLEQGIYVIEDEGAAMQGTGFFLKDFGFITYSHVIDKERAPSRDETMEPDLFVYLHSKSPKKQRVKLLARTKVFDCAMLQILHTKNVSQPCFEASKKQLEIGMKIYFAGYPNYSETTEAITITRDAEIKNRKKVLECVYYEIDKPILTGNSGGPVFDQEGRVVGIVAKGGEDEEQASQRMNAFIPIEYVTNNTEFSDEKTTE